MATTDAAPAAHRPRPAPPAPRRLRSERRRPLAHLALIVFGLFMLYPLIWMVSSSFKPTPEIFRQPGLIPRHVTASNYPDGWTALPNQFGHYLLNSALVSGGAVIGNVFACSLAAYAFA